MSIGFDANPGTLTRQGPNESGIRPSARYGTRLTLHPVRDRIMIGGAMASQVRRSQFERDRKTEGHHEEGDNC